MTHNCPTFSRRAELGRHEGLVSGTAQPLMPPLSKQAWAPCASGKGLRPGDRPGAGPPRARTRHHPLRHGRGLWLRTRRTAARPGPARRGRYRCRDHQQVRVAAAATAGDRAARHGQQEPARPAADPALLAALPQSAGPGADGHARLRPRSGLGGHRRRRGQQPQPAGVAGRRRRVRAAIPRRRRQPLTFVIGDRGSVTRNSPWVGARASRSARTHALRPMPISGSLASAHFVRGHDDDAITSQRTTISNRMPCWQRRRLAARSGIG